MNETTVSKASRLIPQNKKSNENRKELGEWFVPIIIAPIIFFGYAMYLFEISRPIEEYSLDKAALFGDSFGFVNTLFSGAAFLLLVMTLNLQRKELSSQREEMRKMVATQTRQLHIELQKMAIENPGLNAVWYPDEQVCVLKKLDNDTCIQEKINITAGPVTKSYVNLIVSNWEMLFVQGLLSEEQLKTTVMKNGRENQYFQDFWENAKDHRAAMAEAGVEEDKAFHKIVDEALSGSTS